MILKTMLDGDKVLTIYNNFNATQMQQIYFFNSNPTPTMNTGFKELKNRDSLCQKYVFHFYIFINMVKNGVTTSHQFFTRLHSTFCHIHIYINLALYFKY